MIGYNDLYELVRKEKYNEMLQQLPKHFIEDVAGFFSEQKELLARETDLFSGTSSGMKKQLENSIALFRELMRIRKKKILNLSFIGTETGIMKRDYENLLSFEKDVFDILVKTFEDSEKKVSQLLNGRREKALGSQQKMIIFNQDVEQFVDMSGALTGPFSSGQLVHLETQVAELFVSSGKAAFVDE